MRDFLNAFKGRFLCFASPFSLQGIPKYAPRQKKRFGEGLKKKGPRRGNPLDFQVLKAGESKAIRLEKCLEIVASPSDAENIGKD